MQSSVKIGLIVWVFLPADRLILNYEETNRYYLYRPVTSETHLKTADIPKIAVF
jgi:hypothetical protein